MSTKRMIWSISTLVVLTFFLNGCKVFKKNKCDCPKFGQMAPIQPVKYQYETQELVLVRDGLFEEQLVQ